MAFSFPARLFRCRPGNFHDERDHLKVSPEDIMRVSSFPDHILGDTGIPGLRIDFNSGLRLEIPKGAWHVRIGDAETGMVFFDEDVSELVLISVEKFYIVWQVDVWLSGEPVFSHTFDAEGQEVFIRCLAPLGDALALLPYIREFQRARRCHVICEIPPLLHDFADRYYPDIERGEGRTEDTYASYTFVAWMDMDQPPASPVDGKLVPIERLGQALLGIETPLPKNTLPPSKGRSIKEPYVCISVQASDVKKAWLWPGGWDEVVRSLKSRGYRVLCIDKMRRQEQYGILVEMPEGAEDFTGDISIQERLDMIAHADFFVGLASGLSWLSYYAGTPVVLIAGFTLDWLEFPTPYRVSNKFVCGGCYNDVRVSFHLTRCPYHEGTQREFECQRMISPRQVIAAIDRLISDKETMRNHSQGS